MYENTIFVFGSNREGRHGKGAARKAMEYGAIYGQAEGLQGNAYGIITKELRRRYGKVLISEVREGVERFLAFAVSHPTWAFTVTPIGCGLAGFSPRDIAPLFRHCPRNVLLPCEFQLELLDANPS